MTLPILKTKLYIPPVRPNVVSRPHLIERLEASLERKLTLISAPAGFGKTTLLSQWVHALDPSPAGRGGGARTGEKGGVGVKIAWLSLGKNDNEPERFWTYAITALQTAQAGLAEESLELLLSGTSPSLELVLSSLINELIERAAQVVLILDDFHHIDTPAIHQSLAFLLEHLPPQLHLVLAGRSDPPLPLSRLRGQGQLNELRAADLRFTSNEVATFLNQTMGLGLSAEDITALGAQTEGWIAGLQLAALWLQGQDRDQIAGLLTALGGSHRYILDYLTEEVLERQPEDIQSFLLQTSILDSLSGPLCDAVAGPRQPPRHQATDEVAPARTFSDSQSLLEHLERSNLFVLPLDDERRWYRYHHLFGDLLRSRLEQAQPERVQALHMRASTWYEDSGMITEAVGHALAADNVERVARLVARNAFAMLARGELTTVVRQLDTLPKKAANARPWLGVARAWARAYAGPIAAVESHLRATESALDDLGAGEALHIASHIATIRAYIAAIEGQVDRGVELSRQALDLLPRGDLAARGFAATMLASLLRWRGELRLAAETYEQAINVGRASGDIEITIDTLCDVATLQTWQGLLHAAMATCKEAIRLDEEHTREKGRRSLETGYAYTRMGIVLREWNDLEAARRCTQQGLDLVRQWGQLHYLSLCQMEMAKMLQADGDREGALEAIQSAKHYGRRISPWYIARAEAWEARLQLAQGNLEAAAAWAQRSGPGLDDDLGFHHTECYLALARVLLAQDRLDEASRFLMRLLELFESAEATGYVIETLVLQSLSHQARGQIDLALTTLGRALILAQPQGYVRLFIEEGAPMGDLLRQTATRGMALDYVGRLLAAQDEWLSRTERRAGSPLPKQALIEPLSDREMEVLELLAAGLANKEIADRLVIALGTVKNHLKSIYGKLDAHTRVQAVARAQEIGLL